MPAACLATIVYYVWNVRAISLIDVAQSRAKGRASCSQRVFYDEQATYSQVLVAFCKAMTQAQHTPFLDLLAHSGEQLALAETVLKENPAKDMQ